MNYYVLRNGQKFGPYQLADLQRYVASGDILTTDLAQSEGMQDWIPVSQVIGNIGVAAPAQPPAQNYGQMPGYAPMQGGPPASAAQYPNPPDMHWALLLVLAVFCGLFVWVWIFIQAAYVKKIDANSKGMLFYGIGLPCIIVGYIIMIAGGINGQSAGAAGAAGLGGLLCMAGAVMLIVGHFNMKASLEQHFNSAEPINLRLSGVMTFFFNVIYFQYHFTRINNWRKTGMLM